MKLNKTQLENLYTVVLARIKSGVNTLVFEKADGSIRVLNGTLDNSIISEHIEENDTIKSDYSTDNKQYLRIWDTDKNAFRSFRLDSLLSLNSVKIEHLVKFSS